VKYNKYGAKTGGNFTPSGFDVLKAVERSKNYEYKKARIKVSWQFYLQEQDG
jgi:hypothetical protein